MNKIILGIIIVLLLTAAYVASAATVFKGQPQYLYQWTTSKPSVAGVDPNTGYVTPVWYGTAEICAQLKSDLSVKFCNTVTVQ